MKAADLRKAILQYAVEGKLVPQDNHDEPASLLYEKIIAEKENIIKDGKIKKEKPLPPITDDDIPYNIPENWKWVRLGEIIALLSGQDLKLFEINNEANGIPYITGASAIKDKKIVINRWTTKPIVISQKNDILITCKGTIGKVVINYTGDIHIARQIMNIKPFSIYNIYLYLFLLSYQKFFIEKGKSIIPGISRNDILHILFPLPPLKEQERIVKKVDELMALCDKLEQEEEKLLALDKNFMENLPKSILQYAVEGKLIRQDIYDEPASILYEKIIAEKENLIKQGKIKKEKPLPPITDDDIPYNIPENWKWVRLGEVGYTQTGTTPAIEKNIYQGNHIPFIKPADISNFSINYDNENLSEIGKQYSRVIEKNSILMVCIGGSIGKCFFNVVDVCCNQQINTLTPFKYINLKYTLYTMQSQYFYSILRKNAGGTATPIINKSKWENLLIPLPPLKEQERIVEKVDELLTYCNKLKDII